nr:cysteine-rich receptor-like protein kinase 10 isoform X2 [Lolium perenne]
MKYFSLVLLVVLAASPLSTTANVMCDGVGTYTANSTYEANLRRLASILPAEISSSPQAQGLHALGYWPNRLRATWTCFGGSSSSCSACIAAGFRESEGECPYSKEFFFSGGDCQLHVADFRAFERFFRPTLTESMALVMALQAVLFALLKYILCTL